LRVLKLFRLLKVLVHISFIVHFCLPSARDVRDVPIYREHPMLPMEFM
jgi:hypothetical protein